MSAAIDEDIIPVIQDIVFRKCALSWELPACKIEGWNLTYVIQGEARYIVDSQTLDLTKGSLLAIPPESTCRATASSSQSMHCFMADFGLRGSAGQSAALPFPLHSQPGRHEDIVRMLHDAVFTWQGSQSGRIIKTRGIFLQVLHRFMELVVIPSEPSTGDTRITRAVRYLATNYSKPVTVRMMAEMAGLTPTYFGILFQKAMGVSFNRYLIQLRVKNAEQMLASGTWKVSSVAEACGFTDVSHFYKQFKAVKGYPPSHSLPKKF